MASTNSLNVTAAAQGTSATPGSGAATTTAAGELVVGAIAIATEATVTAGSGYTLQERVPAAPNTKLAVEDRVQTAAGSIGVSATLGKSDAWGAVLAAFRPTTGAPTGPDVTLTKTHVGSFTQGQTRDLHADRG